MPEEIPDPPQTAPSTRQKTLSLLRDLNRGEERAADELLPLVYDELRRIAGAILAKEFGGRALQPTALVHEAYLRLVGHDPSWENRKHFVNLASKVMRQVLVDHARRSGAAKRGGKQDRITLTDSVALAPSDGIDLLGLDEALTKLAALDERKARVVDLRFFGGLTIEETAEVIGVSTRTVETDWAFARAWLCDALSE